MEIRIEIDGNAEHDFTQFQVNRDEPINAVAAAAMLLLAPYMPAFKRLAADVNAAMRESGLASQATEKRSAGRPLYGFPIDLAAMLIEDLTTASEGWHEHRCSPDESSPNGATFASCASMACGARRLLIANAKAALPWAVE